MLQRSAAAHNSKAKEDGKQNGQGKGDKPESTSSAEDIRALRLGKVPKSSQGLVVNRGLPILSVPKQSLTHHS